MNPDTAHIHIMPFSATYQPGIDAMLDEIATEYAKPFFHQPYQKMEELALLPGRHYWVAVAGEDVVAGTVGVVLLDGYAVLKSMFVAHTFRGAQLQVANRLMEVATNRATEAGAQYVYLGTMAQFKRAQAFYEKQGYTQVHEQDLPQGYPTNALDTVFYRKQTGGFF